MPQTGTQNERAQIAAAEPVAEGSYRALIADKSKASVRWIGPRTPLHQTVGTPSIAADGGACDAFTTGRNLGSLLYTPDQRRRRDESPWTLVQGLLAPIQFAIFLTSLGLVVHYLVTGQGYAIAAVSIVVKTLALYAIMVTGAIWEREVFGCYLFARAFFWEDVFSMLVLALHTIYLIALATQGLAPQALMVLALAAYATYVINAGQFILKLRAARLQRGEDAVPTLAGAAS